MRKALGSTSQPPPHSHYWAPDVPGDRRKSLPVSWKVAIGRALSPSLPLLPTASLVHMSHDQTVLTSESWLWFPELVVLGLSCLSFAFPSLGHVCGHMIQRKKALGHFFYCPNSSHSFGGENVTAKTSLGGYQYHPHFTAEETESRRG